MAKPIIKFKTYRQSAAVGGKIYGVPNLGDPVVASVTMQEVIDYAKLHNYSAATLEALLSQVISGVADLVARDGKPRNLSDLLKFEPVIKGTFDNLEQTVTDQKILVRPRLLKEIRVKLDASDYAWQNQNDKESPRLISVAPFDPTFSEVSLASFLASLANPGFGWTYAGRQLCPNGYDANCSFGIRVKLATPTAEYDEVHYETDRGGTYGSFAYASGDAASDNTLRVSRNFSESLNAACWYIDDEGFATPLVDEFTPQAGDTLIFSFTRTLGTGDTFTVEKSYTL